MDARELLRSGDARAALEQLKQEVRKAPRDVALRTFLFQMFCVFGEWERAVTQVTDGRRTRSARDTDGAGLSRRDPLRTVAQAGVCRRPHADRLRRPGTVDVAADRGEPPARVRQARRRRAPAGRRVRAGACRQRQRQRSGLRVDRRRRSAPWADARGGGRRQILLGPVPPHARSRYRTAGGLARPGLDARAFPVDQRRRVLRLRADPLSRLRACGRSHACLGGTHRMAGKRAVVHRPRSAHADHRRRRFRVDGHPTGRGPRAGRCR